MTREEATKWLKHIKECHIREYEYDSRGTLGSKVSALLQINEALDMAIEALSAQTDYISRADAVKAIKEFRQSLPCADVNDENFGHDVGMISGISYVERHIIPSLPSADRPTVDKCDDCLYEDSDKSLFPCNYCKRNHFDKYEKNESNYITGSANDVVENNDEVIKRPIIEHDREWIIGCIKHDGFIHTHRFDTANQIILEALQADAVQGWIPLSHDDDGLGTDFPYERDGQWVIVTNGKCVSVERIKKDAYDHFFPNGRWFDLEDVVAWMPLPKPYKGGDDE